MISGARTFSEQAEDAQLHSWFDGAISRQPGLARADWYVSGPNAEGRYSLLADDGLQGHELGRSDATGLHRLQELVRLHNGQQAS